MVRGLATPPVRSMPLHQDVCGLVLGMPSTLGANSKLGVCLGQVGLSKTGTDLVLPASLPRSQTRSRRMRHDVHHGFVESLAKLIPPGLR
jgi:hypothetical protein